MHANGSNPNVEKAKSELERFLASYGDSELVQEAAAAQFDSQLRNLSLPSAQFLTSTPSGNIIDVGAGNGVLLQRLSEIAAFNKATTCLYIAVDYPEKFDSILNLAAKLRVHRKVEVISLDAFYSQWIPADRENLPSLVIIRNVFHELNIPKTAQLVHTLHQRLRPKDQLLVQDLQVLPEAERGNACWSPDLFEEMLEVCGFNTCRIDEVSNRGNRWFTVSAQRKQDSILICKEEAQDAVIRYRRIQHELWTQAETLVSGDNSLRCPKIALLDFDLQRAALQAQLNEVQALNVALPSKGEEEHVLKVLFTKSLETFDPGTINRSLIPLPRPTSFRDRARDQDCLEEYLWSADRVAVVSGGPFMGKSVLVEEVLARRAHERQPLVLGVEATFSVWNLLERYFVGIGCAIQFELLRQFRDLQLSSIAPQLGSLFAKTAARTVVVFDHFERLLDPNGKVQDAELRQLMSLMVEAPGAKVIITTQRDPDLVFLPADTIFPKEIRIGRFPEGKHVENLLNDWIDRTNLGISSYPEDLLIAIDRYPYLAVLAAQVIKSEGPSVLSDPVFLDSLRGRLRDDLIRRIIIADDRSRPAVELLSLLRVAVPRQMFVAIAGHKSVEVAEQFGLLYSEFDRQHPDLLTGAEVLRAQPEENEEISKQQSADAQAELVALHKQIAAWYSRLYRETEDPRWIREMHYHTLLTGDESYISGFGISYRHELFLAGNYWFRTLKNFRLALKAFEAARSLGLQTYLSEMRYASCLVRVGRRADGETAYRKLLEEYSGARGLKTSYVDSLLYVKDHAAALKSLVDFEFNERDGAWVAHQYGRSYFGLHRYKEAAAAFRLNVSLEPHASGYWRLARAYLRLGQTSDQLKTLQDGLRRYKNNRHLRLSYAAYLVRQGEYREEAEQLLRDLYGLYGPDGAILQQLCKLLCLTARTKEAERLFQKEYRNIYPERYQRAIEVEIRLAQNNWRAALNLLSDASPNDEHAIGLKLKLYLNWARSETDASRKMQIAKEGLAVSIDPILDNNIPILVMLTRLATLASDTSQYDISIGRIEAINPEIATSLRTTEEYGNLLVEDLGED